MKLITEVIEDVSVNSQLDESNQKKFCIEGIFMQAEKKNKNGRVYPKKILEKETTRYINEKVKKNRAYGELNHPTKPTVDLERAAILVNELAWNGNDVHGKATVMNTPKGKILQGILEAGGSFGVSSRAMGSLKESDDGQIVQSDYSLYAIDVVSDPSAPEAFVNGIMEGVEWVYDSEGILRSINSNENTDFPVSVQDIQEAKIYSLEKRLEEARNTINNIYRDTRYDRVSRYSALNTELDKLLKDFG